MKFKLISQAIGATLLQGWSNPIARRPGLPIFGVGQVKNYRQHAHGQVYFMASLVQSWYLLSE